MKVEYAHRGARALVVLHEHALREFVEVWRRFRAAGIALPETDDPSYASPAVLLRHVLGCARGYLRWMCENLDLPDPEIREAPAVETIEDEAEAYLEHLIERWQHPLVGLDPRTADRSTHESSWGVPYCIDAMLEHAVMHPVRHSFQLRALLGEA